MAKMTDVARAAGVSVATVSHVLNGTRYVSPELSNRVRDAMLELGYTRNATARSLRLQRTHTIGLVVPDISNPHFGELARIVEDTGITAGYTTVVGNSARDHAREREYLETLMAKRVDGLIVVSIVNDSEELADIGRRCPVPVVVVDRDVDLPAFDVILADHAGGAYAATSYLIGLGHERIACIGGPGDRPGSPSAQRIEGFERALADAGIARDPQWTVRADFQYEGGRAAMGRLLDSCPGLTAVFAANDLMAIGAMSELRSRGFDVPSDFSVVGFDDAPPAAMAYPALTTVRQPLSDMGRAAFALLLDRMPTGPTDTPTRRVFPTELVVRESAVGPVRTASAAAAPRRRLRRRPSEMAGRHAGKRPTLPGGDGLGSTSDVAASAKDNGSEQEESS